MILSMEMGQFEMDFEKPGDFIKQNKRISLTLEYKILQQISKDEDFVKDIERLFPQVNKNLNSIAQTFEVIEKPCIRAKLERNAAINNLDEFLNGSKVPDYRLPI